MMRAPSSGQTAAGAAGGRASCAPILSGLLTYIALIHAASAGYTISSTQQSPLYQLSLAVATTTIEQPRCFRSTHHWHKKRENQSWFKKSKSAAQIYSK
jgi:hypothetical protein